MIVNYKALGAWSIAVGKTDRCVVIVPGVNEVVDKDWDVISKHPAVKAKIEEGVLVLVKTASEDGTKKKAEGLPATLEGMTVPAATDFIGGVFNIDQLKAWKKKETRQGVITAIDKQIGAVRAVQEPEKKE